MARYLVFSFQWVSAALGAELAELTELLICVYACSQVVKAIVSRNRESFISKAIFEFGLMMVGVIIICDWEMNLLLTCQ